MSEAVLRLCVLDQLQNGNGREWGQLKENKIKFLFLSTQLRTFDPIAMIPNTNTF